jgi:ABC-2 type transport system ATP-binding protein
MEPRHVIRTESLTRRFGERLAVDRLTLDAGEGEIVGLLGPNGAGKTTTIRMLAGIIAPTSGSACVEGIDPTKEPERVHERIGLLTESPGFYERLSAERNLAYFAGFYRSLNTAKAVHEGMARMGLVDRGRDRVATFSKGMKQRLALARALLHDPRVLFLDEPTAGLDPEAARELRVFILNLKRGGRTILLSTHNLAEAEQLCDRIAVFRTELVACDTPAALRARQSERAVRVRVASVTEELVERIRAMSFVRDVQAHPGAPDALIVRLEHHDRDRPRLVSRIVEGGGEILEVAEEQRSLEDVYLELVREEE